MTIYISKTEVTSKISNAVKEQSKSVTVTDTKGNEIALMMFTYMTKPTEILIEVYDNDKTLIDWYTMEDITSQDDMEFKINDAVDYFSETAGEDYGIEFI